MDKSGLTLTQTIGQARSPDWGVAQQAAQVARFAVPEAKEVDREAVALYAAPVDVLVLRSIAMQLSWRMQLHRIIVKSKFDELLARWKSERPRFSSSTESLVNHPAYQEIIGLGPAVIPFILDEMKREPDYWFWALATLAETNPVPLESRGDLDKMTKIWLDWGRSNGCV